MQISQFDVDFIVLPSVEIESVTGYNQLKQLQDNTGILSLRWKWKEQQLYSMLFILYELAFKTIERVLRLFNFVSTVWGKVQMIETVTTENWNFLYDHFDASNCANVTWFGIPYLFSSGFKAFLNF